MKNKDKVSKSTTRTEATQSTLGASIKDSVAKGFNKVFKKKKKVKSSKEKNKIAKKAKHVRA
jgi:hypothetical protein